MYECEILDAHWVQQRPVFYPDGNGKRILIVDDSKSDVAIIKHHIRSAYASDKPVLLSVPRVSDALELLDEAPFDLILLDLFLLDITGIATVAALHAECPNIPIIVYSSTSDPKIQEEAILCGASSYLVKGNENNHMLNLIINQTIAKEAC